jgi:hypothetical protein
MKIYRDESGTVALIFSLLIMPVIAAIGVAVDYSRASDARSVLQQAADAAALAGRMRDGDARESEIQRVFATNVAGSEVAGITAKATTNSDGSVTVTASHQQKTILMSLFNIKATQIAVTATAQRANPSAPPASPGGQGCFLLLDRGAPNGLITNGNAAVDGGRCEAHVHSAGSDAFIHNSGTTLRLERVCLRGRATIRGQIGMTKIEPGCEPVGDTIGARLPPIPTDACTHTNRIFDPQPVITLSPGTYCGDTNFNGKPDRIVFSPGLYVIRDGAMNLSANRIEGDGVTFVLAGNNANFQMNGQMEAHLKAPKSGVWSGVLFRGASNLPRRTLVWNAQNGQTLEGLVYLPTFDMHMNIGQSNGRDKLTLVAQTMIVNANTDWKFGPREDWGFGTEREKTTSQKQPSSSTAVRLVK